MRCFRRSLRSRGLPVVVLQDAAEPLLAPDTAKLDRSGADRGSFSQRRGEPERRVRASAVVVVDVLVQEMIQMPGPEHDEVIEALGLDALDEPLDVGVEVRRAVRKLHGLDAGLGECFAECTVTCGELAVAVAEQEPGLGHVPGQRGDEPPDHLFAPGRVGIRSACRYVSPAGPRVHEHQRERVLQARGRQHAEGQEVAGPQGLGVRLQELVPRPLAAGRAGRQPCLLQDVDDRGSGDAADSELLEFAENPHVAEPGLPRDPQHDRPDLLGRARAARPGGGCLPLLRPLTGLAHPLQECLGPDDRDQGPDGRTERLSEPDQPRSLLRRDPDLAGDLRPKDLVLRFQVLDLPVELVPPGPGQDREQAADWVWHRGIVADRWTRCAAGRRWNLVRPCPSAVVSPSGPRRNGIAALSACSPAGRWFFYRRLVSASRARDGVFAHRPQSERRAASAACRAPRRTPVTRRPRSW